MFEVKKALLYASDNKSLQSIVLFSFDKENKKSKGVLIDFKGRQDIGSYEALQEFDEYKTRLYGYKKVKTTITTIKNMINYFNNFWNKIDLQGLNFDCKGIECFKKVYVG